MEEIIKVWKEHKGEFVITQSHRIERFLAIGFDEEDYYYATYDGRRIMWNSCVGRLIFIKGKLDNRDYEEFIRLAELNHFDQTLEEKEAIFHKREVTNCGKVESYLTEICWEMN
jgi:hypothetical protein